MANKGEGNCYQWILDHQHYDGDYCLIWPFYRLPNGYGQFSYLGENFYAHRYMCELVKGPPPTCAHEAAHSCGNGDGGCAHPIHLSWKTKSENLLDCSEHGTQARNVYGIGGRLSPEQVQQIRDLKGKKTQAEIASIFGVHEPTIRDIYLGRTYARERKVKPYTPEEDDKIREAIRRGYNFPQMAEFVGRSTSAVMGRTYRLGLTSGQPVKARESA